MKAAREIQTDDNDQMESFFFITYPDLPDMRVVVPWDYEA